jgi:hypothetical protein
VAEFALPRPYRPRLSDGADDRDAGNGDVIPALRFDFAERRKDTLVFQLPKRLDYLRPENVPVIGYVRQRPTAATNSNLGQNVRSIRTRHTGFLVRFLNTVSFSAISDRAFGPDASVAPKKMAAEAMIFSCSKRLD